MNKNISNDNNPSERAIGPAGAEPHGQAALLLVESLLHGLIARSVLSVSDAIEIVDIAADVPAELVEGEANAEATDALRKSHHLLNSISLSLGHDVPRG